MVASLDSGIPDRLRDKPRIRHAGANHRFVHNGRLEPHKGIDLAIRAIAHTRTPATLDIIGRGSAEASLRELARRLCLEDRVRFLPWVEDHAAVADALRAYRAFVLPSLAEANGIVVQEAMMLGLPTICLDWGGPSQLIDGSCGVLVKPDSEASVITQIAGAMDRLGQDGELADHLSAAGRDKAIREGYCWSNLLEQWIGIYTALAACRE
jgi:glycosyltransferase involved in cell wall biosynthesis